MMSSHAATHTHTRTHILTEEIHEDTNTACTHSPWKNCTACCSASASGPLHGTTALVATAGGGVPCPCNAPFVAPSAAVRGGPPGDPWAGLCCAVLWCCGDGDGDGRATGRGGPETADVSGAHDRSTCCREQHTAQRSTSRSELEQGPATVLELPACVRRPVPRQAHEHHPAMNAA